MIIPIFFPMMMNNYDDDRHGYDCECSKCKRDNEFSRKHYRQHYEEIYCVPKKWYYKKMFLKGLRILCVLIGIFTAVSYLIIFGGLNNHKFWIFPITFVVGLVICVGSIVLFDKFIKYDWNCDDKIRVEKKSIDDNDWKTVIKNANVPKNYHIGRPSKNWRYKSI